MLDVSADAVRLEEMKAASREIGLEFRRRADPIEGLRRAMKLTGVLH
jgi:hypothetical protein